MQKMRTKRKGKEKTEKKKNEIKQRTKNMNEGNKI